MTEAIPSLGASAATEAPFFAALTAKRDELIARMRSRDLRIESTTEQMEQVQGFARREQEALELRRLQGVLAEVNHALARLSMGLHAICEGCDEPIPEKRLVAIPWTACCLKCQAMADSRAEQGAYAHTGAGFDVA